VAPGFNAGPSAMLPAEKPRTSGASFPYLGLAVRVLALYAILAVVSPPSPIRSVVAIAAFFAMGYCALALIAGNRLPMSPAEILAFTVGLTIILTSVSALAVSIAHIPITEFAVVTIGLPIAVVAFLVRRPGGRPWVPAVPVLHFDATVLGNGSAAYGEYTESIFLPLEGTWTQTYSILVDAASGTFFLTFSLAVANNPKLVREVSLPVDMA